jgi:hypothetical protein
MPGAQVQTHFIRETFGFAETGLRFSGQPKGALASRYSAVEHRVTLALGDDMHMIIGGASTSPLQFFGNGGRITGSSAPVAGQTTRNALIGLLGG